MKQKRNNLFPVFLSTLMIALAFGALVLAAETAMPRGGATLLLLIAAMGAAAAAVTGLKKYRFSFHKSCQLLPQKLAEELDGLNTGDQFELLCRRFAKQNEEFNAMSVERLLGRLLAEENEKELIEKVTLIGLCTDICVISNALLVKAFLPEAEVAVDAACCAGVTPESHRTALAAMKSCQITVEHEA